MIRALTWVPLALLSAVPAPHTEPKFVCIHAVYVEPVRGIVRVVFAEPPCVVPSDSVYIVQWEITPGSPVLVSSDADSVGWPTVSGPEQVPRQLQRRAGE